MADDVREELGLPPATIDTAGCKIRGADGRWYEVPQPVLIQHMVTLGLSSAAVQKQMPRLVRPGEVPEGGRATVATDGNFALLATDELLSQVTAYLESGDLDRLCDVIELCQTLAQIQGVDPDTLSGMRLRRIGELGSYNGRVVFHPDANAQAEPHDGP